MVSSRTALLAALGADNAGSGLFLPVALLYVTRDVGLPPGPWSRPGPWPAWPCRRWQPTWETGPDPGGSWSAPSCSRPWERLPTSPARGVAAVAVAGVLLAAGQQLFYSSLFTLIADVAGDGPKDRPFTVAAMVRSACFGLGGPAAAGLLSLAGAAAYRIAVAVDAGSFAVCALLLALLVRTPGPARCWRF